MDESRHVDGFISYRRDGARLARYLARSLRAYRLPRSLRQRLERHRRRPVERLRVCLTPSRAEPTQEFHEREIRPTLLAAEHLVIVASRSVAAPLKSGEANRVDRETRDFLRLRSGRTLFAVHARGEREPGLPPSLGPHPRVDLVDLGVPAPWRVIWAPAARRARLAIHRCAAALYDVPKDQMPHVEHAAARNENLRGVLRACVALAVLAGFVLLLVQHAQRAGLDARAWTTRATAAREQRDPSAGARALLAALALRPGLGAALAERFAWQSPTAPPAWTQPVDRFRVEAATPDGLLWGSVRAPEDPGGPPDGRVRGMPPAPSPTRGLLDPASGTWTPFAPGTVPVSTATQVERGAWIAVVTEAGCAIRRRAGSEALMRFALPRGQSLERVALHVASRRLWIATRDVGGAVQRLPLGRIYTLGPDAETLQLVKAERSVAVRLRLSHDGGRVVWTLLTGIVRAAGTDTKQPVVQSVVEIGTGTPAEAGFVGDTPRIVVVDAVGRVARETEAGSGVLERAVGQAMSQGGPGVATAFHPLGALAAVVTRETVRLVVLDGPPGEPPSVLVVPLDAQAPVTGAAFTADGARLVVTDRDGRICFVGPTDEALREAAGGSTH